MITFNSVDKLYSTSQGSQVIALSNVSFHVDPGEMVFLVGPSGSGKSTIMRLLTCQTRPTSGTVWFGPYRLDTLPERKVPKLRQATGFVQQDTMLLDDSTVAQNVAYALEVRGRRRKHIRAAVEEALSRVGLGKKHGAYPDELSGGEQQRVQIARALVADSNVLLCDEPTGNLDPETTVDIMRLLVDINRQGTTILMSTHDREIVNAMGRRVIQLHNNTIVRDATRAGYTAAPTQ